jgi:exopolysaccharide biosynthesis polyprenyl glycosylphosphotransferase
MRQAGVAARRRARPSPNGDAGRTIRTTVIAAPRLARRGDLTSRPVPRAEPGRTAARSQHLQVALGIGDALAVLFGFYFVISLVADIGPGSWAELVFQMVAVTGVGLFAIRSQGLWVSRLNAVRAIELSRISRAVVVMGLGTIVLDRAAKLYFHVEEIFLGCVAVWIVLVGWRSVYRTWLAWQRKGGHFLRRVIIVGTDRRAMALVELFETHPEVGIRVAGLVGSAREARMAGRARLWLANYADADEVLAGSDVDGVVLCSSDVNPALLEVLIRGEQLRDRDLYLDPGLSGIDFRRVQALPIAHQPLLYVESPSLSRPQVSFKRVFDACVAAGLVVLLSPLFAVLAVLVKLEDRGPVLFRQRRVGRDGVEFEMVKFRSMCVDAEAKLAALKAAGNERTGPLFKLDAGDPRVTRIGRFLRASSLDELPQLLNVLRGDMSLVGPRPALAAEVAEFPAELNARHDVRPGITGLWQVEARDNPSFQAYRRLDLFYVENWSLALDLVILLGTAEQVLLRPFLRHRRPSPTPLATALAA